MITSRSRGTRDIFWRWDLDFYYLRTRDEDYFWREYLRTFFASGGIALEDEDEAEATTLLSTLVGGAPGFDCVWDCLFHQSEPWIVENLTLVDTWIIGILCHTDSAFRFKVRDYLDSFRSPFCTPRRFSGDDAVESSFGIREILNRVKSAPPKYRVSFLKTISLSGTPSMLRPFLDARIDVNEGKTWNSYLGNAAANGQVKMFHMLLDAGANTALALPQFLRCGEALAAPLFEQLLLTLLENIVPTVLSSNDEDPLPGVLSSTKALQSCPQAPNILFRNGIFREEGLYGQEDVYISQSYMLQAILASRPVLVELLLDQGAEADVRIGHLFRLDRTARKNFETYTWLTLAVEWGRASCADVLVKHGARLAAPDGSGRTALQLARSHVASEHPRFLDCYYYLDWGATAAQDAETLAVLEGALVGQPEAAMAMGLEDERSGKDIEASSQASRKSFNYPDASHRFGMNLF